MKKLIAIPLLFLYLTAVSGAMIQIHYCGSKIASWNVNKDTQTCCCEPGGHKSAVKEKDCCSSKTITLKINEAQNHILKVSGLLSELAAADISAVISFPEFDFHSPVVQSIGYRSNAPPGPWQKIPLAPLKFHILQLINRK